ncbi:MAG: tetratricopeptide repeat protein [Anaerolineales bacterium]|nr:tetratricopeptide repeat protein [Anaerolineales bacterium]
MSIPRFSQESKPIQPAPEGIIRFSLLGDVQIVCDKQSYSSLPHRTHGLLAALLLYPKPLRREYLAGLLFPDAAEQYGRSRLSDLLWLLRRSLPDLRLETNSQELFLPPNARWLDVEAFREAAAEDNLDVWLEAITLYRGNLLERLYDDWLVEERESLYLQYVHLSHRVCNKLIHQQRYNQVLPIAERLVQAEPYDESALRNLMNVYRELGRRGAALAAFERFLTLSTDELGIEPETATLTLAQSLRIDDAMSFTFASNLAEESSSEALIDQARQAAVCSDAPALKSLVEQLRALSPPIVPEKMYLIEIDLALCAEEYECAARLLENCQPDTAPLLVRQAQLAFHLRQADEAREKASEALILAHDSGDRWIELHALLVLSQAQRLAGMGVQSARSAEQALKLAHTLNSPGYIIQALKSKGYTLYRQGRSTEALTILQEMRSLAYEHGLRTALAEALRGIALIYGDRFACRDAMLAYQEELSIWRDVGSRRREVQTLHNLAIVMAQLGRFPECLRLLENARQICEQLCDPVEMAINQYNIADSLIDYDEANASQAIALINQALDTFRNHQQPAWEAAASTTLGCALWIQEKHQPALEAFRRAHDLYEKMGELPFLSEMLAYQVLTLLGLGQADQALAVSRHAIISLVQGEGFEETTLVIYYAHSQALEANGQVEQARAYLERAYQRLLLGAAQLEDEPARQAFFTYHPITRRVMEKIYAYGIAPAPAAGVITRQLSGLQAKSTLPVRLTLDAGLVDAAIKATRGAVGLRRARLIRLLQEAQMQGARLTQLELAQILDVSMRTIKRDMAALRRE